MESRVGEEEERKIAFEPLDRMWTEKERQQAGLPCLEGRCSYCLWRWRILGKDHVLMEDQDSSCEHVKFGLPVGHLIR